jgi:hypothetical protein
MATTFNHNPHPNPHPPTTSRGSPEERRKQRGSDSFASDLNRIQEAQVLIAQKLASEKQRSEMLDSFFKQSKVELRALQEKLKNGTIVQEYEVSNQKQVSRCCFCAFVLLCSCALVLLCSCALVLLCSYALTLLCSYLISAALLIYSFP